MKKILLFSLISIIVLAGCTTTREVVVPTAQAPEAEVSDVNQEINITLELFGDDATTTFALVLDEGASVLDALKKASKENNFSLDYQESDFGIFVEEINSLKNSTKTSEYWTYDVNGEYAEVGAGDYMLEDGDIVVWKYSKY